MEVVITLWIVELVKENRGKKREERGDISDQKDQMHTREREDFKVRNKVPTKGSWHWISLTSDIEKIS